MKTNVFQKSLLAIVLFSPLALAVGCKDTSSTGVREVTHTENDKTGWFGGQTHEANTVYKNPDGSISIESEATTTKGDTTTITRERKTTAVDGKVSTDRETRTIVKGSDNTVRETKTNN